MALASGDSLGRLIRRKFSRGVRIAIGVLLVALIAANCLNLAADLNAIGQGMNLLHAGPAFLWSAIAGIGIAVAVIAGSFEMIGRIFKWLCLVLLVYVGVLVRFPRELGGCRHAAWSGAQLRFTPAYLGLVVGCARHDYLSLHVLLAVRAAHRGNARGGHAAATKLPP